MIDLNEPLVRAALVRQMQADLDAACKKEFEEDPRKHLGASIIGHDCAAYAWNTFRWLKFEDFSGRMLRLFNRGHEEERRFVRWLRAMGFQIFEFDEETKKQYRIVGAKGHFGGSLDGVAIAPPRYNLGDMPILAEFKTHSEKSFTKLAGPPLAAGQEGFRTGGKGVQAAKPMHYKQMCSYGRAYGFRFGLYCAVNKNTDEIHFEVLPLDYMQADFLFQKAENIVFATTRPPKLAQVETYFECKFCDFAGICHRGQTPSKNCRSCAYAIPVDGAQWVCNQVGQVIPEEYIPQGCNHWRPIA